jgi:NhaA family Na+:H+ antiporter
MTRLSSRIADFMHHESAAGVILIGAALLALLLDNSPLAWAYEGLLALPVSIRVGALALDKPLLLWINDGLMAIFFFLVGLEIKRELIEGELAGFERAALPGIAALGGMLVPALIYLMINARDPAASSGWAIPAATDIAFAMAVLSVLGSRVPASLRAFLLALAIIDDLGAIIIIAIFYTSQLSWISLLLAAVCALVLLAMNRLNVARPAAYLLVGLVMWICVLKSGVHATLSGVLTAFAIPLRGTGDRPSMLHSLVDALHPWVALGIMPIFAFANSGVSLAGVTLARLVEPVTLGIALGLFIGKQLGVFGFTYAAVKLGIGRKPDDASWTQIYGIALLAGIGFTMSLFIGTLAFTAPEQAVSVRLGVIVGSLASALVGFLVLHGAARPVEAGRQA